MMRYEGTSSFDEISNQVDKYSIPSESINKRQVLILREVEDFLENEMDTTAPLDYDFPSTLDTRQEIHLDPNRSSNGMVQNKMGYVF
jgi:hypothetical protein